MAQEDFVNLYEHHVCKLLRQSCAVPRQVLAFFHLLDVHIQGLDVRLMRSDRLAFEPLQVRIIVAEAPNKECPRSVPPATRPPSLR